MTKHDEGRIDFEFGVSLFSEELTKELVRVCKAVAQQVEEETIQRCIKKCAVSKYETPYENIEHMKRLYSYLNDGKGDL